MRVMPSLSTRQDPGRASIDQRLQILSFLRNFQFETICALKQAKARVGSLLVFGPAAPDRQLSQIRSISKPLIIGEHLKRIQNVIQLSRLVRVLRSE